MNDSTSAAPTTTPDESRRQLRRAVIASTVGTTIEWYDFFLYSIVAGLVFAKLYFPKADPLRWRSFRPTSRSASGGRCC